jgi:hypothetical protein
MVRTRKEVLHALDWQRLVVLLCKGTNSLRPYPTVVVYETPLARCRILSLHLVNSQ